MILDKSLEIAKEVAITTSGQVGDVIDCSKGFSAYEDVFVVAKAVEEFVGGTSLRLYVETSDDEAFADGAAVFVGAVVPVADLTAGAVLLKARLPFGIKRYIRAVATVVGTFSAGKVNIDMALDVDKGLEE